MQVLEKEEDFGPRVSFKRNGSSLSCGIPSPLLLLDSFSQKSFSYNKLPQEPLKLHVLKLDGSSFEIEVAKMATVAELKQAVEAAFSYLPKNGPEKVSWSHVWGHFCLCYDNQKLLTDSNYIGCYGIKEGDQLQFIRHTSINYNLIRTRSEKQDPELEQPRMSLCRSYSYEERQKKGGNDDRCSEQEKLQLQHNDDANEDNCVTTRCEYRLAHLLKGWFSYRRLTSRETSFEEKSSSNSAKLASGFSGSSRSNKYSYGTENQKGE